MSTSTTTTSDTAAGSAALARPAGFGADLASVAMRALRQIPRDPEAIVPAILVGVFFYAVQIGALQDVAEQQAGGGFDYKAFMLPMGIVFTITGVSRAAALVTDIQGGYFDRLLVTPVRRPALLLGLMVADLVLVLLLASVVTGVGLVIGVRFVTGWAGIVAFLALCAFWGLSFAGFPYAVALRTGNPAAVNSSWLLFMPFAFLTTAFVPREAMTGWMATATLYNPVSYLLDALRAIISEGWAMGTILKGVAAVGSVFVITFTMSAAALRGRVSRG